MVLQAGKGEARKGGAATQTTVGGHLCKLFRKEENSSVQGRGEAVIATCCKDYVSIILCKSPTPPY